MAYKGMAWPSVIWEVWVAGISLLHINVKRNVHGSSAPALKLTCRLFFPWPKLLPCLLGTVSFPILWYPPPHPSVPNIHPLHSQVLRPFCWYLHLLLSPNCLLQTLCHPPFFPCSHKIPSPTATLPRVASLPGLPWWLHNFLNILSSI